MKKVTMYASATALAITIALGATLTQVSYTPVAFAQDTTAVPATIAQSAPVQTSQQNDNNNGFPWGLLGLLGLAGLAGMRRQPEPVRSEPAGVKSTVGMYDSKK